MEASADTSVETLKFFLTSSRFPNKGMLSEYFFPVRPLKKSAIASSSPSGILAVVRMNCTLSNEMSRRENNRSRRSAISPPEEPLYI